MFKISTKHSRMIPGDSAYKPVHYQSAIVPLMFCNHKIMRTIIAEIHGEGFHGLKL